MSDKNLELAIEFLVPFYQKYCELTGKTLDWSKIPKRFVTTRKDLPALFKPKKIQSCADEPNKV